MFPFVTFTDYFLLTYMLDFSGGGRAVVNESASKIQDREGFI